MHGWCKLVWTLQQTDNDTSKYRSACLNSHFKNILAKKNSLSNSQLTSTTSKLSQHSIYDPENYRGRKERTYARSMVDLANNLEALSQEVGTTLSKGVSFEDQSKSQTSQISHVSSERGHIKRSVPLSGSEFNEPKPGESLRTDVTDDELLRLYEEKVEQMDMSGKPLSPRGSQWFVNPNHLDTTVEAPTLQSIGKTYRHGAETSQTTYSDKDEIALKHFPVTMGSAYELCALGYPTARPLLSSSPPSMRKFRSKSALEMKRAQTFKDHFNAKQGVDKCYLMTAEMPTIGSAGVYYSSPHQTTLGKLRLERLRLEETKLLELKRLEELERIRGPKPKWYESKGPDFYYESRKNTQLVKSQSKFQDLLDYREDLLRASYNSLKRYNDELNALPC